MRRWPPRSFVWGSPLLLDWLDVASLLGQAAVFSLCCIVAFYYNDLYDLRVVRSFGEFATRLLQGLGVALLLLAGFYAIASRTCGLGNGALVLQRARHRRAVAARSVPWATSSCGDRAFSDRVLILGTGPLARKIMEEIEARPHYRYRIVGRGRRRHGGSEGEPLKYPLLGPLEHLGKIADEVKADRIIVALAERRGRMPMRQLLDAEAQGILVEDGMATYEQFTGKLAIEALSPSFLVFSRGFRKTQASSPFAASVSLVAAAVGLVVAAPLMAADRARHQAGLPRARSSSSTSGRATAATRSGSSSSAPCAIRPRRSDRLGLASRRRGADHAGRTLAAQAEARRAAPAREHPQGGHGPGRAAARDRGEHQAHGGADPLLRAPSRGASRAHGLGAGALRLLGEPGASHGEDAARPLLHQAHVLLAGPPHPRGYREDRALRPGSPVAFAAMSRTRATSSGRRFCWWRTPTSSTRSCSVLRLSLVQVRRDWHYLLSRRDGRSPAQARTELPPVTLIIAAHNEEAQLRDKLANIRRLDYPRDRLEVIFVSDGSTDGTNEILREAVDDPNIRCIFLPDPRGQVRTP